MEDCLLAGLEMHFELQFRRRNILGTGRNECKFDECVVQAFIREQHLVLLDMVFQAPPSLLPVHTAHLEYVGEVGAISHAEWHDQSRKPVIGERELFIAGIVPQELGPLKVQSAPRDGNNFPV